MQTCRKILTVAAILLASRSFAQIANFDMPTISAPTIGTGFYMPGSVLNPAYMGNPGAKKPVAKNESSEEKVASQKDSPSPLQKRLSTVTASDLSILNNMGMRLSGLYSGPATTETKAVLDEVLQKIESLKQETESNAETAVFAEERNLAIQNVAAAPKAEPRVLRFSVNDYDILKTCRRVFISDVQADGTFLVTGDRRYVSDGKNRKETFHLLFKTTPAESGASNYTAAASVTQDYLNENSFLYQMAQRESLIATRIGNLITMRTDDASWKLELLIDLGEE